MDYEDVVLTDHAKEKEKIPEFLIKSLLEKEKGRLFHDRKEGSYLRVKGRTVVVFAVEEGVAVVITAYRKNNPYQFSSDRFKEVRTTAG